jgi:hypothetical protein
VVVSASLPNAEQDYKIGRNEQAPKEARKPRPEYDAPMTALAVAAPEWLTPRPTVPRPKMKKLPLGRNTTMTARR